MHYDGIVIGGSYAGLSAAMQLARARRSVCVIDAGQPRNRFADASHGFFGQDGAAPQAMIAQARRQLAAYPTVTILGDEAVTARKADEGRFEVVLATGESVTGSGIVLAHGVGDVLPDVPGIADRWGHSVLHCPYCHGYEYAGRRLGVLNTHPGAVHQAQLIAEWGPTTYFLNGTDAPDAETLAKLEARGIAVEPGPVDALEGEGRSLSGVRLADGRLVEIEALFIAPARRLAPFAEQLGCELDDTPLGPTIRIDTIATTTVPGVFAAGDVTTPAGNATLASAEGVRAGTALHRSLIFGF